MLGLIAGAGDGLGRRALMQLLDSGVDVERQRFALQLLGAASLEGAARGSFRAELDRLLGAPSPHPILEDLLLFRAQWALSDQPPDYPRAEADAHALLDKFPGSLLKAYAAGILTASDWEQQRYLNAARDAARQQAETPPGDERAELGVLRAEALFRAGTLAGDAIDFSNAAAAYAAALRAPPAGVAPGELMFQRVESEIEAGLRQIPPDEAQAQRILDELEASPAFDLSWRWRAESNLARMLRIAGQTQVAYARVNRLLAATGAGAILPAAPSSRPAWRWPAGAAFLSMRATMRRTLELVAAWRRSLRDGLSADLHSNIAAASALLEAQADFALRQELRWPRGPGEAAGGFPARRCWRNGALLPGRGQLLRPAGPASDKAQRPPDLQLAERLSRRPLRAPTRYFQAALLAERLGAPGARTSSRPTT